MQSKSETYFGSLLFIFVALSSLLWCAWATNENNLDKNNSTRKYDDTSEPYSRYIREYSSLSPIDKSNFIIKCLETKINGGKDYGPKCFSHQDLVDILDNFIYKYVYNTNARTNNEKKPSDRESREQRTQNNSKFLPTLYKSKLNAIFHHTK